MSFHGRFKAPGDWASPSYFLPEFPWEPRTRRLTTPAINMVRCSTLPATVTDWNRNIWAEGNQSESVNHLSRRSCEPNHSKILLSLVVYNLHSTFHQQKNTECLAEASFGQTFFGFGHKSLTFGKGNSMGRTFRFETNSKTLTCMGYLNIYIYIPTFG